MTTYKLAKNMLDHRCIWQQNADGKFAFTFVKYLYVNVS